MRYVLHSIFGIICAIVIAFTITQLMQSSIAFKIMKPVAETRANWSGQIDLFSQKREDKDVIVIGDKHFVSEIRTHLGEKYSIYQFSSYEGSINTLAEAYILANPNEFKFVILQNRPFYWTDYWATPVSTFGNFGDNRLWSMSKEKKLISRSAVKLFFTMLEVKAMKLTPNPEVKQPVSMAHVSWRDWPSDPHFYFSNMRKVVKPDKTFWVRDVTSLPADLPTDIFPTFNSKFGEVGSSPRIVPGIGISIDAKDLAVALESL